MQKHSESYGKYEDGNIIGFDKFQEIIDKHCKRHKKKSVSVMHELIPDMKYLVVKTIESVKNKLNQKQRRGCFELFGFDFMVDNDLTVWLIECNTNPCLDESNTLLRDLLPRMIDDLFRLTIDKEFPGQNTEKLRLLMNLKENNFQRTFMSYGKNLSFFNRKPQSHSIERNGDEHFNPTEVQDLLV